MQLGPLTNLVKEALDETKTALIIISSNSITSDWVKFELQEARQHEKSKGKYIICPIAIDANLDMAKYWNEVLINQLKKYNILDFSDWKEDEKFNDIIEIKLLPGLYKYYL